MLLADARIDPNIKDRRGNSPLMFAIKQNLVNLVEVLLPDPRVDLSQRDNYKRSEEEVKR